MGGEFGQQRQSYTPSGLADCSDHHGIQHRIASARWKCRRVLQQPHLSYVLACFGGCLKLNALCRLLPCRGITRSSASVVAVAARAAFGGSVARARLPRTRRTTRGPAPVCVATPDKKVRPSGRSVSLQRWNRCEKLPHQRISASQPSEHPIHALLLVLSAELHPQCLRRKPLTSFNRILAR